MIVNAVVVSFDSGWKYYISSSLKFLLWYKERGAEFYILIDNLSKLNVVKIRNGET